MPSVVTNRDRGCLECRAVSGTGLIGIGAYVAYQAKRNSTFLGKTVILGVALGKRFEYQSIY